MPIQPRDLTKYPEPGMEPRADKLARLGLREMDPTDDALSWGQNAFVEPALDPIQDSTKTD